MNGMISRAFPQQTQGLYTNLFRIFFEEAPLKTYTPELLIFDRIHRRVHRCSTCGSLPPQIRDNFVREQDTIRKKWVS